MVFPSGDQARLEKEIEGSPLFVSFCSAPIRTPPPGSTLMGTSQMSFRPLNAFTNATLSSLGDRCRLTQCVSDREPSQFSILSPFPPARVPASVRLRSLTVAGRAHEFGNLSTTAASKRSFPNHPKNRSSDSVWKTISGVSPFITHRLRFFLTEAPLGPDTKASREPSCDQIGLSNCNAR